jgi:aspartyl-tRNA(Asn)/glutamyl-tRNA(Gln) amidotransferase subunit C
MSLDTATVRRIASLARIRLEEEEVGRMQAELNGILGWIEQLQAVPTDGVEPMAGGGAVSLRMRDDVVTDGGIPEKVLANAPDRQGGEGGEYFGVPKVVE